MKRITIAAAQEGSVLARCRALDLSPSSYYYQPKGESALNLELMRLHPLAGSPLRDPAFNAVQIITRPIYLAAMSVRTLHRTDDAIFFCTFTCWSWIRLIELTQCYDRIYAWMSIAHDRGFRILGYVIMPNHVHVLLHAPDGLAINPLLGNAKRFLAYDIVARLKAQGEVKMLERLQAGLRQGDVERGQMHRVFATSSDIRECFDEAMIVQKLEYMHANPVSGGWALAEDALEYAHSSATFYHGDGRCLAPITHYDEIIR